MKNWLCCQWSVWCLMDMVLHRVLPSTLHHSRLVWWICDKHDAHITNTKRNIRVIEAAHETPNWDVVDLRNPARVIARFYKEDDARKFADGWAT